MSRSKVAWLALLASLAGPAAAERRVVDVAVEARDARDAAREVLGPGAELRERSVRRSLTGTHVRFRTLALDGTPVLGADASVHFRGDRPGPRFTARLVNDPGRGLWSLVGRRRMGEGEARAAAAAATGGEPAFVEAVAIPAGRYAARPAWRVFVDLHHPRRVLEVRVDADDGSVAVGRDILERVDGTGWVFSPNPVTTTGDRSLRDNADADSAALTAAREQVTLQGLDGMGYLRGEHVDVTGRNGGRVLRPSLVFDFTRSQDEFEEVNAYYHIDRIQRQVEALGFVGAKKIIDFSFPVRVNTIPDDNSFFHPLYWYIEAGTGGVDDAEDGDVLAHEYGHALMNRIVPDFWEGGDDADALGEGFGDLVAYAIPTLSSKAPVVPRACIAPWDATGYGRECMRRVDGVKHWPEHLASPRQEHDDGELYSGALHAAFLEAGLQPEEGFRIALESVFDYSRDMTFADAAAALLEADRELTGGRNVAAFRRALLRHGLLATLSDPVPFDDGELLSVAVSHDSPHPVPDDADGEVVIEQRGAGAMRVHFASLDFETDDGCVDSYCDAAYVYDGAGNLYARLGGSQTDVDGPMVPGDRVVVRWVSNGSRESAGLVIDRVDWVAAPPMPDAGIPDAGVPGPTPDARRPGGSGAGDPEGGCAVGGRGGAGGWLAPLLLVVLRGISRGRRPRARRRRS